MQNKTFNISKISCGHCVNTIQTELKELPGILSVKAASETKMVSIEWDDAVIQWNDIETRLDDIGFPPD